MADWLFLCWDFVIAFKTSWLISESPPPSAEAIFEQKLTSLPLLHHWWRLTRENGIVSQDRIKFYPDGRMLGVSEATASSWKIEAGALQFLSASGAPTAIFAEILGTDPVPVLRGKQVQNEDETYFLMPNLEDMHVEIFQTRFYGNMMVIPTSRGRPFDGVSTRWELWHLPREAGIDHMRLAEHIDSKHWYTNKTTRIMHQLRVFVAQGYRSFCFFGLSSGGYAAILLAERLASEFEGLEVCSIAINPQTQLGDEVSRHFCAANIPPHLWPDLITDEDLSQRDIANVNLKDVISADQRKSKVEHHVFYDVGNACEEYFAGFIEAISNVTLHRYAYGLSHAEGIRKIYEDNRAEIERLIVVPAARR